MAPSSDGLASLTCIPCFPTPPLLVLSTLTSWPSSERPQVFVYDPHIQNLNALEMTLAHIFPETQELGPFLNQASLLHHDTTHR